MKTIIERKLVETEIVTYVAEDGEEFKDESCCIEHERIVHARNIYTQIPKKRIDPPISDGGSAYYAYLVRNKLEETAMCVYLNELNGGETDYEVSEAKLPMWFVVEDDAQGYYNLEGILLDLHNQWFAMANSLFAELSVYEKEE